jgi:hypothetical protein
VPGRAEVSPDSDFPDSHPVHSVVSHHLIDWYTHRDIPNN